MMLALKNALETLRPQSACVATAYLTPDGFRALNDEMDRVKTVRVLLGERPFLRTLGPGETLASDGEDLFGPEEAISWYDFLEGNIPWILMNHEERKRYLEEGKSTAALGDFDLSAWGKVRDLVEFLSRDGVSIARHLGPHAPKYVGQKVLTPDVAPDVHLHAKAYLFRGASSAYAAVGSSNLTKGGLENNVELNLTTTDPVTVGQLES